MSLWCLYFQLWTDFSHSSAGSIDNFEQVNIGWILFTEIIRYVVQVLVYIVTYFKVILGVQIISAILKMVYTREAFFCENLILLV